MQEENNTETTEKQLEENQAQETPPEVVEFSWEDAQQVLEIRKELFRTQEAFSAFLFDVEKRKAAMMSRFDFLEKEMYTSAQSLQEKYEVSPEHTYELKLPTKDGEKGYFIRKDD